MNYKTSIITLMIGFLAMLPTGAMAQSACGIENKAFKSNEFLTYDLYFNWKFVWVKVGSASMSTVVSTYNGTPCYRTSLTTRGNNKLDNFFVMRDTLLSYCSVRDLSPVYFRKGDKIRKEKIVSAGGQWTNLY